MSTLFGLIAVTGLRINEALALNTDDVDIEQGTLTVQRVTMYITERDRVLGKARQALFVQENGKRVSDCSARYNFASVSQHIGLRASERFGRHGRGPRIHDLRHSFAARTMINWYRVGKDAGREMIKLSTYLGHSDPDNTYWYLEAVPELLELAARRITEPTVGEVFPALLQRFFTDRLSTQMEASTNTVAGYRDTFRLLLRYAGDRLSVPPTKMRIEDLDAELIADFLVHVEI